MLEEWWKGNETFSVHKRKERPSYVGESREVKVHKGHFSFPRFSPRNREFFHQVQVTC